MEDKRTPMEPAELLEMQAQQPLEDANFYGTAVPQASKKQHTLLLICLGLSVIAFCTASVLLGLSQARPTGSSVDVSAGVSATETMAPEQLTLEDQQESGQSLQLQAPQEEALSAQAVFAKVSPSVVMVQSSAGAAAGVVVSSSGYVITDETAAQGVVQVTLEDGAACSAVFVAQDDVTGLGLICLQTEQELTPAELSYAGDLAVGQQLYLVANPYGAAFGNVLVQGMLSAQGTDVPVDTATLRLLQVTADTEGQTGCPVVNSGGQVVAITTSIGAKLTSDGSDPGFAVTAESIVQRMDLLLSNAEPAIDLGFTVEEIPEGYRRFFQYPGRLWIMDVEEEAIDSGLCLWDVITAVDGEKVESLEQYQQALAAHSPDTTLDITLYRAGRWYVVHIPPKS